MSTMVPVVIQIGDGVMYHDKEMGCVGAQVIDIMKDGSAILSLNEPNQGKRKAQPGFGDGHWHPNLPEITESSLEEEKVEGRNTALSSMTEEDMANIRTALENKVGRANSIAGNLIVDHIMESEEFEALSFGDPKNIAIALRFAATLIEMANELNEREESAEVDPGNLN